MTAANLPVRVLTLDEKYSPWYPRPAKGAQLSVSAEEIVANVQGVTFEEAEQVSKLVNWMMQKTYNGDSQVWEPMEVLTLETCLPLYISSEEKDATAILQWLEKAGIVVRYELGVVPVGWITWLAAEKCGVVRPPKSTLL